MTEFEENGNQINSKTLKNVPFTTAFIKEVLRLSHAVDMLVPRESLVDIKLPNGLVMPEGTNYAVDIAAMQLSEARFQKSSVMNEFEIDEKSIPQKLNSVSVNSRCGIKNRHKASLGKRRSRI